MVALGAKWVLRVRWAGQSYYSRLLSELDLFGRDEAVEGLWSGWVRRREGPMSATLRDLRTSITHTLPTPSGGCSPPDTRGRGAPPSVS